MIFMFHFSEESMDVDPNYDPSDFLMKGLPHNQSSNVKIHDDLAVSESDDESGPNQIIKHEEIEEKPGDLWF